MKKYLLVPALLVCSVSLVFAQKDSIIYGWKNVLAASLNLTQTSYTDWTGGGDNAIAFDGIVAGQSIDDELHTNWTTTYKFAFGQTKLDGKEIRKTDDIIDILSVLTYKLDAYVNPFASIQFTSQFATGYQYKNDSADTRIPVSDFLDPGYLTEAAGIGYQPIKELKMRLGAGLKETFTNKYNQYAAELSDPAKIQKTKVEGGAIFAAQAEVPVDSNLLWQSKMEAFAPFKTFDQMTVRWDNTVTAKISKYFNAVFGLLLVDDPVVSTRVQIKEGLALGIIYAIF